jgi:putative endonuclease
LRDVVEVAVKPYYVYILASRSRNLYIGVTNDLERRVYEHKKKLVPGFTAKYNIDRLVHFETTEDVQAAIAREKQIKGWVRSRKVSLIESVNPTWDDLGVSWCEEKKVR